MARPERTISIDEYRQALVIAFIYQTRLERFCFWLMMQTWSRSEYGIIGKIGDLADEVQIRVRRHRARRMVRKGQVECPPR